MTLIIKEENENTKDFELKEDNFDKEGYSYIIDGNTEFHDMANDPDNLSYLAKRFVDDDPTLI